MDKVLMPHLISFSRYQIKSVINFKIFLESTSKAMADREKKRENENTKI